MKLRHVAVVWAKELTDGLRDRRSLFSALVFPLVGPVLVLVLFRVMAEQQGADEPLRLPVVGADNAPGLVAFLGAHDVEVGDSPADPETAVRTGEAPAVLLIPDDYAERFRDGRPAQLQLLVDNSRNDARTSVRRAHRIIEAYGAKVGSLRLLARGVDPQLAQPVVLADVDLATPKQRAANILNVIPMFVMMAAFIGGMYVATDSTAGERERGSLESLLVNPVARSSLALGKWLATSMLAGASLLLTLVTAGGALARSPLEELGVEISFGALDGLRVAAVMLPVAFLAAGLQLVVATFARSFREAQTYLSVLTLLPMMPGMFLTVAPLQVGDWSRQIPILGQQALLLDVVRGEPLGPADFAVPAMVAVAVGYGCACATAWLLGREKIVFGN